MTGRDDVRLAVQAMKAGCADFLMKPLEVDELVEVAERALGRVQLRREHSRLVSENLDLTRAQALYRQGLQILSTLDGERLQDVALSVLARVTDAQGAALWTADERGHLQLRAYRGVVDRAALPARVDPAAAEWAGPLRGGAPFPAPFAGAGEGFLVALVADDEPVGVALLSDRAAGSFGPEEHQAATTIADFTAIAVKNARRFQAVERVGPARARDRRLQPRLLRRLRGQGVLQGPPLRAIVLARGPLDRQHRADAQRGGARALPARGARPRRRGDARRP